MRVLHLDIDGGYGGSSRSLSLLVEGLLETDIQSEVWYKREGPSLFRTNELKIKGKINKNIASIIPLKKNNIKNLILSFWQLKNLKSLAKEIIKKDIDLLHLNYEGLLPLSLILKFMGFDKKIIVHVRHMIPNNFYSKIFVKLFRFVDGIIFISEMEKKNILAINSKLISSIPNEVIYNCASNDLLNNKIKVNKKYYRAIFLGRIDRSRAPDRLIKLAQLIKKEKLPIKFYIYGKDSRKSIFNKKQAVTKNVLKENITFYGLKNIVFFKGFTNTPEKIITKSDILISPDRMNEPWGRDIIESLSAGLIVIATGKDEVFIKNNINGFLVGDWNAQEVAKILKRVTLNKDKLKKIKEAARLTAENLLKMANHKKKISLFFYKV